MAFILRFFTEFHRFSGRLYHSGWRQTYNVCKILSPSSSLLLLAKTITDPAARSLCDSWASCKFRGLGSGVGWRHLFSLTASRCIAQRTLKNTNACPIVGSLYSMWETIPAWHPRDSDHANCGGVTLDFSEWSLLGIF